MLLWTISACTPESLVVSNEDSLFLLRKDSGIAFRNDLIPTETLNPYTYRNFYNGGGVALGDINNDGLLDIYFTGNQVDNKLYLNKGNWKFEDITISAGVACEEIWSTGATFVDINADGFLDLYVCKAGPPGGPNRNNQMFLNNGDLSFSDVSKEYGLDITGLSIHSAFFDFDKDGDLDCYLLSNSIRSVGNFDLIRDQRNIPDSEGNKFLINEKGHFRDASEEVGIYSSKIGYGLGITLSDFNSDGWTDIFVSNDFFEKDYLYINQKGEGFQESGEQYFQCFSLGSMGADAADLNNDLLPDLFVTEMLPKANDRKKTKMLYESWDKYKSAVDKGYFHQAPRNMLQRNMGAAGFLEISRSANVAGTDWSWASLLCDLDNDGLKDIFVSNGIGKDLLDRDYLAYMADGQVVRSMMKEKTEVIQKLVDIMPSEKISNVAYRNMGNFQFEELSKNWGLDIPSFSNGSAYGDLDNDGDLDLVVSNVDDISSLYENRTDTSTKRFIAFELQGKGQNKRAIGSKVEIYTNDKKQVIELFPSRGFQSSVTERLHFGVNNAAVIDSAIIYWPNGGIEKRYKLESNRVYNLTEMDKSDLESRSTTLTLNSPLKLERILNKPIKTQLFNEFNRERLLTKMTSYQSPSLAIADINQDGMDDLFYGGGFNQSAGLLVSDLRNGKLEYDTKPFDKLSRESVTETKWLDYDSDGDLDLYIGIGGRVFSHFSKEYDDYVFLNDGHGTFSEKPIRIATEKPVSTGAAEFLDIDKDGSLEFVSGTRVDIQTYGASPNISIYKKTENSQFELVESITDDLGMITGMALGDLDGDGSGELIVCGEWMPIRIFSIQDGGKMVDRTTDFISENTSGFWQTIKVADLDGDGDMDLIAGNIGNNSFLNKGDRMYVSDFDLNGSKEQIICNMEDGRYFPKHDYDEIVSQISSLRRSLTSYEDYSTKSMSDLFEPGQLSDAITYDFEKANTSVWLNNDGQMKSILLPSEIQYSSVHAIEVMDVNKDGVSDILLGGNDYNIKPQYGRSDASKGWLCYGQVDENGTYELQKVESMDINGEIRAIKQFNENQFIIATADMSVNLYSIKDEN